MNLPVLIPLPLRLITVRKRIIFVNCFDTLCYRYIHPSLVTPQWALVVFHKYSCLSERYNYEDFCRRRRVLACQGVKQEDAFNILYKEFAWNYDIDRSRFVEFCRRAEIAVEVGCLYLNREMVVFLRRNKRDGKKIYLISDSFMTHETFALFLNYLGCANVFDGIYVSNDVGCDKHDGRLYSYVLDALQVSPRDVLVIGDNLHLDVEVPEAEGMKSLWYFPVIHKVRTNCFLKFGKSYNVFACKAKGFLHQSLFGEYSLTLFYSCSRLYEMLKKNNLKKANFLSRGGYMMKKCYDAYQYFVCRDGEETESNYLKTSRKACFLAENAFLSGKLGANDYVLLKEYLSDFEESDGRICLVDEGWYNHSQQCLAKIYHLSTYGFYIGSCEKEDMGGILIHRQGLLFDVDDLGKKSPYYNIFIANRSLYEQLLTSADGSVKGYYRNPSGSIKISEKINEQEQFLYTEYTNDIQKQLLLDVKEFAVWNVGHKNIDIRALASVMLYSVLLNNKKRCAALRVFDQNRFDNLTDGEKCDDKMTKDFHFSIRRMIVHPSEYVGTFCKLQRCIYKKPLLNIIYKAVALIFIVYIKLSYLWDD